MSISYAIDHRHTLVDDAPTAQILSLTAHLARSRTAAASAEEALFEAVITQADASRNAVRAVRAVRAVGTVSAGTAATARVLVEESRTAARAATPTTEREQPHPQAAPVAPPASSATWPGSLSADPTVWLAGQLHGFSRGERVDPYAELMLRRAGFAPAPR